MKSNIELGNNNLESELKTISFCKEVGNTLLKYLDKFMNIFDTFPVNID